MRRTLSKKERTELIEKHNFIVLDEKETLQYDDKLGTYYSGRDLFMLDIDSLSIPFLKYKKNNLEQIPSVIVDMPAIPYLTNGADLLRPGIVKMDNFAKDALIIVRDEKNNVALAIMKALYDSEDIEKMEKGKVAKSLHYVNDKHWKAY